MTARIERSAAAWMPNDGSYRERAYRPGLCIAVARQADDRARRDCTGPDRIVFSMHTFAGRVHAPGGRYDIPALVGECDDGRTGPVVAVHHVDGLVYATDSSHVTIREVHVSLEHVVIG